MKDLQIITPVTEPENGSHQLHIHSKQMAHYIYAWIPKI